jgi:hypothetical protein
MRIPEFGGSGPVWIREVKLMSLATAVNSAIALHNLEKTCSECAFTKDYVDKLRSLLEAGSAGGSRLKFIGAYDEFRRAAAGITKTIGTAVLRPYWRKNKLPFVGTGPAEPEDVPAPIKTEAVAEVVAPATAGVAEPVQTGLIAFSRYLTSLSLNVTSVALAEETSPAPDDTRSISSEAYQYAGKYVAFQYSIYIGYILHQLQNLLVCSIACFVLLVTSLNSFSFQAPHAMSRFMMITFAAGGCAVLMVLAQMERDPILSRLSGTTPGELGKEFYVRVLAYGALPVLTMLSTQFPAISRFISMWIQPAAAALR